MRVLPVTLQNGVIVQYFERARFAYHPELAGTPNEILLGLLGVELGFAQPPVAPPTSTVDLQWYFTPTGLTIATPFRSFWSTRGGLLTYGYPIGEAFVDSNGRLVQYFERTRLELHEELPGRPILLGLLGEELFIKLGGEIEVEVDDD